MPFQRGLKNVFYKHGLSQTRFYRIYRGILRRCYNKRSSYYHRYGGRGITVCEDWNKFENFINDMYNSYKVHVSKYGEKNTTINRVNNNRGYNKANCSWVTVKEQSNNSDNCHYLEFNGKKQSMTMWSRELGISYNTLRNRINNLGWSTEKSLTVDPILGNNQFSNNKITLNIF